MRGLQTGPLAATQADAVAGVWRADACHDDGEALVTAEDFATLVKRPSCDLERDSVGVRDGDRLVAFALVIDEPESFVHVLPSHRGRGIGGWLLRWTQDAGRAAGHERSDQSLSENAHAAAELLVADGFEPRWESWVFTLEQEREPAPPRLPTGYSIRAFEHAGDVVGAAVLVHEPEDGWVEQLAVARAHRGRGLGRALLDYGAGVTWRRGVRRFGLGTDSRTGARGLYEHLGMHVRRSFIVYSKPLAPGASG